MPPFVYRGREVLAVANITAQSSHHTFFVTQILEIGRKITNGKVKAGTIIPSRRISALEIPAERQHTDRSEVFQLQLYYSKHGANKKNMLGNTYLLCEIAIFKDTQGEIIQQSIVGAEALSTIG
jgi:hypothetical protein